MRMALIMNFVGPYLLAMRDRAPKMFQELRRHGRLQQHLHQKDHETRQLLNQLLKGNENPSLQERRTAEEIVRAMLIEFPEEYLKQPRENRKPPDDLNLSGSGKGKAPGEYAALMANLFQQQKVDPKVPDESDGNEEHDAASNGAVGSLSGIEKAIRRFARERFERVAQDIATALQEHQASGVYGDDAEDEDGYPLETLWDEFRYEVQFGPHDDVVDFAWNGTLRPFYEAAISAISDAEMRLLFLATEEGLSFDPASEELPLAATGDELIEELDSALRGLAGKSREHEEKDDSEELEQR